MGELRIRRGITVNTENIPYKGTRRLVNNDFIPKSGSAGHGDTVGGEFYRFVLIVPYRTIPTEHIVSVMGSTDSVNESITVDRCGGNARCTLGVSDRGVRG